MQQRLTVAFAAKQRRDEIQRLCVAARDLMSRGRFEEALKVLEGAAVRFPDAGDFPRLIAEAEVGRQEAVQRQDIEQTLAAAAALVETGQAEAALRSLEEKQQVYTDSRELADAAARLRQRLQAAARQQEISARAKAIEQLIASKQWGQAIALAEAGQQQYPDAPVFAGLKRRADAAQREQERAEREAREAALREARTKAEREAIARAEREHAEEEEKRRKEEQFAAETAQFDSMLHSSQIDAATQVFERIRLLSGDDPRLPALRDRLTVAVTTKQRRDEIQRICADARELMSRGKFDEALTLLEGGAVRYPDAEDFPRLIADAETGRRDALRKKAIEQVLSTAAALVEKGQAEVALRGLEQKQQLYPDSRELADAAARLRERVQAAARQQEISENIESIERLIGEKKWAQALALAEAGQQQYPDTPVFAGLKRRVESAKREWEIEEVVAAVAEARKDGNLNRAAELVAAGRARFGDEQRLKKLFYEIDAALSDESMAQARPLIDAGKFEEAETLLHEALARRPKFPAAQELLKEIAGRKAERLRQQRLRERAIAETSGDHRHKRRLTVAASVTGVAIIAGAVWWGLRPPPPPPPNPPAIGERFDHPTAVRGEPYAGAIHASGGSAPLAWSLAKGALPPGLTLSRETGLIEGTPSAEGSFNFVTLVTDREGRSVQREFAITVKPPPVVNRGARLRVENAGERWTLIHGENFTEYLRASGGAPPRHWTISKRRPPRGLSVDPQTGRLRGAAVEDGVYAFTATVTDVEGHSDSGDFTITVKPKQEQAVVSPPDVQEAGVPSSCMRGENFTAELQSKGGSGNITWAAPNLPRGLNLAGNGRIDGVCPDATFSFTARATDAAGKTGERPFAVTVKVKEVAPPPCTPIPYDYNNDGGDPSGTITWDGNLPVGGEITITRRSVSSGRFRSNVKYLRTDGAHVTIKVAPPTVRIREGPSERNCWEARLVLHNEGPPVSSVTITWRTIP
jgi:hypothetical protein